MGGLIKAEFRKLFSTNLWWGLLIATALLGFAWSWVFAVAGKGIADILGNSDVISGLSADTLPFSVFGFARAVNIMTIFPMILGALAVAGEINRKTITTTYLTAPNRGATLSAKLAAYGLFGVLFGIVISSVASLGILVGARPGQLPDGPGWFLLFVAGVISTLLWTLLGVGVGALLGNVFAALFGLLLYVILIENTALLVIPASAAPLLPNSSADGIIGAVAAALFKDGLGRAAPEVVSTVSRFIDDAAGAPGAFAWWLNTVIFAGYTVAFVVLGWLVSARRDIT